MQIIRGHGMPGRRAQLAAAPTVPAPLGVPLWVWGLGGAALLFLGGKAMAAIKDPIDFVKRIWAATEGLGLVARARLIIIAHGAYETGWGRLGTAVQGYNYWNLSAGTVGAPSKDWTGPVILGADKEYTKEGKVVNITQRWRAFASPREAVLHYLSPQWINPTNGWNAGYRTAGTALRAGDAVGFVQGLRAGGYFTLPLEPFVDAAGKQQPGYQAQFLATLATAEKFAKQAGVV